MRALFRLLVPARGAPAAPATRRETVALALADGREVEVLRVRDPRARRLRLTGSGAGSELRVEHLWRFSCGLTRGRCGRTHARTH
ncbi:MAG: hypothetical protein ACK4MU_08995, partial [Thermomonas sp.]